MALKIDDNLLVELGLGSLPAEEKRGLLSHIYETLEMRVGMRLADQMTNEQLDEFERYFEAKDDAGAFNWLESNFPNYKDIVNEEFEKLKLEVGQSAQHILNAGGQSSQPLEPTQAPPQGQLSVHHDDQQATVVPQQPPFAPLDPAASQPYQQPQPIPQPYYPQQQQDQSGQPPLAPQQYAPSQQAQPQQAMPDWNQPQYQPQPPMQSPAQPQSQPSYGSDQPWQTQQQQPTQQPIAPQPFSPQPGQPYYPQQPMNPPSDTGSQPPAGFPPQQ